MDKNIEKMLGGLLQAGLKIGAEIEKELKEKQAHPSKESKNPLFDIFEQLNTMNVQRPTEKTEPEKKQEPAQKEKTQETSKPSETSIHSVLERLKDEDVLKKIANDLFGHHVPRQNHQNPAPSETKESPDDAYAQNFEHPYGTKEISNGVYDVRTTLMEKAEELFQNGFETLITAEYLDSNGIPVVNPHLDYTTEGVNVTTLKVFADSQCLFELKGYDDGSFFGIRTFSDDENKEAEQAVALAKHDLKTALIVDATNEQVLEASTRFNRTLIALNEQMSKYKHKEMLVQKILNIVNP